MTGKIIGWNINLAANRDKNLIPDFVGHEITEQAADMFVLTEFCKTKNYKKFINRYITDNNYDYIITNNSELEHNDVLIAWKKDKFKKLREESNFIVDAENKPNFSYVILENNAGEDFVLAGVRIRIMADYKHRKEQMDFTLNELKDYKNVVIVGDFNCFRRGTSVKEWSLKIMNKMCEKKDFSLITPSGQSIYAKTAGSEDYEFAEDNIIVKGLSCNHAVYNRDFTEKNPDVYLHEKNFTVYNSKLRRNTWEVKVGSGVPDHAIIVGEIKFGIGNERKSK